MKPVHKKVELFGQNRVFCREQVPCGVHFCTISSGENDTCASHQSFDSSGPFSRRVLDPPKNFTQTARPQPAGNAMLPRGHDAGCTMCAPSQPIAHRRARVVIPGEPSPAAKEPAPVTEHRKAGLQSLRSPIQQRKWRGYPECNAMER